MFSTLNRHIHVMTQEEFKNKILPLKNSLYRFALRMLNDRQEAEDNIQEVFIKLWNLRRTLHKYNNIGGFAMTINKNMCFDRLRTRKQAIISLDEVQAENYDQGVIESLENKNMIEHIEKIVEQLPEQQKMIFHLRDIEGYEYEDISETLSMSINTIRVNLSRAKKKIKESLQKTYNYGY